MHVRDVKTKINQWRVLLLVCVMTASAWMVFPAEAQAATTGWGPGHFFGHGGRILPGFWVTGEVTAVEEESVTVQLPSQRHTRGLMRHVSLQVTLAVDSSTILLDEGLEPLTLATLQTGDEVMVSPRLVWGKLMARLLYTGDAEDLMDATYRGRLVEADGDTLTLEKGRNSEFTVLVDANTIWYDEGQVERPAELPDELMLRVLGVEEEDEAGDEVIRAVLITPGRGS